MFDTMKTQFTTGPVQGEDHILRPRRKRFAGAIFLIGLLTGAAFVIGILGFTGTYWAY